MRARWLVLALFVLAACDEPAATGPSAPSTASPPPPLADRALRLPTVGQDAQCPTTPRQAWSGPGVAGAVLGDGPVYPVADYFGDGTVLRLRDNDRRPDGMYEAKVRWISTGYTGPVLARAARIDGTGAAGVTFSYFGQRRDDGYYAELTAPDNDIPATTTVSGPGCYAYQVDGATFTTTIVFRAAVGP